MFEDTVVEADIHPVYTSAGRTDMGRLRPTNQDAFVDRSDACVWAVADGMGGHRDGDIASRMVCEALQSFEMRGKLDEAVDELQQCMSEGMRSCTPQPYGRSIRSSAAAPWSS